MFPELQVKGPLVVFQGRYKNQLQQSTKSKHPCLWAANSRSRQMIQDAFTPAVSEELELGQEQEDSQNKQRESWCHCLDKLGEKLQMTWLIQTGIVRHWHLHLSIPTAKCIWCGQCLPTGILKIKYKLDNFSHFQKDCFCLMTGWKKWFIQKDFRQTHKR